jgi:ubiquinone/menaquinone biosynthesis C-methylase UbiE
MATGALMVTPWPCASRRFHANFHATVRARFHDAHLESSVSCRLGLCVVPVRIIRFRLENSGLNIVPLTPTVDLAALKNRQQASWSSGDYALIGTTLQLVGETLCEALDLRAGSRVLDVAAGNGNISLAAARRGCAVTATDYVPALLERARERAAAERLELTVEVADAEALPYAAASFDVVVSTFGVMFTADHARAAAEMLRVCRVGGQIGLANWTPEGFIGQVLKTIAGYLPPSGALSPSLWGTRAHLDALFGAADCGLTVEKRHFAFRYRSVEQWLATFRGYYGPMLKAFAALDTEQQAALTRDLLALATRGNRAGDGTMVVPSEYLEVIVTPR